MTEQDYIDLIITTIGGDTTDGLLAATLPTYWALHSAVADDAARALLVQRDTIMLLLGQSWRTVSFKALDGASVDASDIFDHLLELLKITQAAIDAGAADLSAAGAVGQLVHTAPV